ncbi:NAD(P)H-binding protein [Streptomyces corynorhini]|uniref:SDR family NAD(P)-dependent oxidoreductase n=1 Tax=Streptomyces corynorhini TaxID=2282652 RepID=A0A370BEW1_9ACTN|nr:NAD(P)H-binding protein [Streptomyces corynorhini]RDG38353.1 SDR family NAD(P)-dependent oxidoreductase [Streptomyces corynorhini]
MILLTGVTGTVGRLVARRLRTDEPVRLLARAPGRIAGRAGPGTEIVGGDFADPGTLAAALTGVRAALLVTCDPLAPAHDEHFVTAARRAGVRHVVKLSARAVAEPDATDLITGWQRDNEALLRASGLAWTFLRPRAFMSNTLGWARSIREEAVVRVFGGAAAHAVVDPRDIADVAVLCLTTAGHEGRVHALTGPVAISAAEQLTVLSEVLQRPLRLAELTRDQALRALLARCPPPVAEALMESALRRGSGAKAGVEPTVERLLGRPATSYRAWAADHARVFLRG